MCCEWGLNLKNNIWPHHYIFIVVVIYRYKMILKISGPKYELKILNWKLRSKTQFTLELRRVNCKLLSKDRLPCRQFCLLTFNQIAFSSPFKLDTYWNVTLVMHALWLCPAKKIFSILHNNSSISHRLSSYLLHSSLAITSSFTINTYNTIKRLQILTKILIALHYNTRPLPVCIYDSVEA